MKENKYDDEVFFGKYSQMNRSLQGLEGAGEWHSFKKILPDFKGKRVLDLGCGFGWHCQYALSRGAVFVLGVDISERMLSRAKELNYSDKIHYQRSSLEEWGLALEVEKFDIIISSLTFHYIKDLETIFNKVNEVLCEGGVFIFSVEHPVFTAEGSQNWYLDSSGQKLYWPVDNYFLEGKRETNFLNEKIIKYHHTLTTYFTALKVSGFILTDLIEPKPEENMLHNPEMKDELRRPMMLIISARK